LSAWGSCRAAWRGNGGKILFDDPSATRKLSIGSGGSAAIYTQAGKPTHIISKVTIRMKKWLLYVSPTVAKG
jgi:membrane fusion protein, multidrug efflux system